ncbi:hypothetical protein JYT26_00065 [Beggiatoa alba]|nr:hypothetical protein [Beggiatoa alba]
MKDAVNKVHELSPAIPAAIPGQQWYEEDSINLVDLWLELIKHRAIIFSSVVLALIAGLLIAFLSPQKYNYSTSIEIGYGTDQTSNGLERTLIDNPETVLAKLTTSYIPQARQHYAAQHPEAASVPEVEVRIPKGSQLIILEGNGPEDQSEAFIVLLQTVLDNLFVDHQRVTHLTRIGLQTQRDKAKLSLLGLEDPRTLQVQVDKLNTQLNTARITHEKLRDPRVLDGPRQAIASNLQKAEITLEKLRDVRFVAASKRDVETKLIRIQKQLIDMQGQATLIKSRYQRVNETDSLLKKQIIELEIQINNTRQHRQPALDNLQTEASAMTMLMVDNEIQQNRLRLANLEERLYIHQQNLRQELEDRLAANQREQGVQQLLLSQLNGDLELVTLENKHQQTLQLTRIEQLEGDLQRLTLSNQRAQQQESPNIAQLEAQLAKLQADHQRKLISHQQNIRLLEAELQGLAETRALAPPTQSLNPTGPRKSLIVILALVLGLMLGVFAAFFASFLNKVKQQAA